MEKVDAHHVGEGVGRPWHSGSRQLVRALRLGRIITNSTGPLNHERLAQLLGVSKRTLYRDLRLLRSIGIESLHAQNRRRFRAESTGELLGRTLTLHEAAAILVLFEHNHQPKPDSFYDRALQGAKQKVIMALREESSAMKTELEAIISTLHTE